MTKADGFGLVCPLNEDTYLSNVMYILILECSTNRE
jgi:hypothetical protein